MACKIKVHSFPVFIIPYHPAQHADEFGALLIHGRRVEIVDRAIGVRTDRVGERACIFPELAGAQLDNVLDALHRA